MKYDSREDVISFLETIGGEDGKIINTATGVILQMPTVDNMYDRAVSEDNPLIMEDIYKAEITNMGYWEVYIKRSSVWMKL